MAALRQRGAFPPELKSLATSLVHGPVTGKIRLTGTDQRPKPPARPRVERARRQVFPALVAASNSLAVPTIREMEQNFRVDPRQAERCSTGLCSACHSLGGPPTMGPDLSAIGTKLDRQALLDAIVDAQRGDCVRLRVVGNRDDEPAAPSPGCWSRTRRSASR